MKWRPKTERQRAAWAIAAAAFLALTVGLLIGVTVERRLNPTDEELWSFAGSALGALIALGGAVSYFYFQRWHDETAQLRSVDRLLDILILQLSRARDFAAAGREADAKGQVRLVIDTLIATRRLIDRTTTAVPALAQMTVSLEILDVEELRNMADDQSLGWCEMSAPILQGLTAAATILRATLWDPELRKKID